MSVHRFTFSFVRINTVRGLISDLIGSECYLCTLDGAVAAPAVGGDVYGSVTR